MPTVKVDDINVYYELQGKGELLVLIQGFTCNTLIWESLVPLLSRKFQVLTFDNRGSGRTDSPEGPYTIKRMAQDTVGLLTALGFESAFILGHSMGGAIVQQICLDFPEKIKKGVLCTALSKVPEKTVVQIEFQYQLMRAGVSRTLLFGNLLPWLYSNQFLSQRRNIERTIKKLMENPFPQTLTGYVAQAQAIRVFDSSPFLESISTPLLIVAGSEDFYTPPSCSEFLAQKIPNAKLHVFEGQGHLLIEEMAGPLSDLVISFL